MTPIRFDNVSKRFVLHSLRPRSFQDLLTGRGQRQNGVLPEQELWALRDVSFQVPAGQTIGLVGPNGAGKSTALKLIARVYEPTRGKILVNGRLNALIELTAGFHPELTGRENIYLSGAVMGLSRREIQRQFDDIVAFSELEKFIDMQVKHYSTGMFMRLGFAVATCIESDILLVDEVLAVGDASFQRKCFERIEEMHARGTTIFYVSHSAAEVERLCDRAILIMDGELLADGPPVEVNAKYEELHKQRHPVELGFYNAEYLDYEVPAQMYPGGHYQMTVTFRNQSLEVWPDKRAGAVTLSYHWLDRWGNLHQLLGPGTALPHPLPPGEAVTIQCVVVPPTAPNQYRLEIDLMGDGRGWFSRHGCLGPQVVVQVVEPEAPQGMESERTVIPVGK